MKAFFNKQFASITIVLIIVFSSTAINFAERESRNKQRDYLKHHNQILADSIENILEINEEFSNYIYDTINVNESVERILFNANHAAENQKPTLRSELYLQLKDTYTLLSSKYHFQQVQFQLANGDSFLRFNNPNKYGDNLIDVRETIKISCKEHRYVKGFEEGRIFAGYRFVYPVWHQRSYVGSVEISLSPACVLKELYNRNPRQDLGFIIDKQILNKCIFADEQYRYTNSALSDDYIHDINVLKFIEANNYATKLYQDEAFVKKLKKVAANSLAKKESSSTFIRHNKKIYLIHYYAVENTQDEPVAYFYSVYDDQGIETILHSKWRIVILIIIVTALLLFMVVFGKVKQDEIRRVAMTDQLTGAYNRHSFYEFAEKELSRARRNKQNVSFGIIDIDYFKRVNDAFGHLVGDEVLKHFAMIAKNTLRAHDVFARFGGEEFIIMLPDTTQQNAVLVMERLRQSVANYLFPAVKRVTISGGVTESRNNEMLDDSIRRADEALYKAKQNGRNQICQL